MSGASGPPGWPTGPPDDWPAGPPGPQHADVPPPPAPVSRTGAALIATAVVVVLVVVAAATWLLTREGDDDTASTTTPAAGSDPRDPMTDDQPTAGREPIWSTPLSGINEEIGLVATDDAVIVVRHRNRVEAFAPEDGSPLWDADLVADAEGWPIGVLDDGEVLVTDEGGAAGGGPSTTLRDATTGEVRWRADGALLQAHQEVDRSGFDDELVTADVVLLRRGTSVAAVDRADGRDLWEEAGLVWATLCGERAVVVRGDAVPATAGDLDRFQTVALDRIDGAEVWSAPGAAAGCHRGEVAISTSAAVAVRGAADGEERDRITVAGDGPRSAVPLPDRILVQRAPGDVVDGSVAVHRRSGGAPLWEGSGVIEEVEGDDLLMVRTELELTVVRPSTGALSIELGMGEDAECGEALTPTVIVGCGSIPGSGASEIAGWALDVGHVVHDPVWMTYEDVEVRAIAVLGEQLYSVGPDALVAYG